MKQPNQLKNTTTLQINIDKTQSNKKKKKKTNTTSEDHQRNGCKRLG